MKSAYEKALERFGPVHELNDDQKAEIAEINNRYKAKVAELELGYKDRIAAASDPAEADRLQQEMRAEIVRQEEKAERERDKVRNAGE